MATPEKQPTMIHALLNRAHSPTTASAIYSSSIHHRPLFLRPTTTADQPANARAARQRARLARDAAKQRKQGQRPALLSAKHKRQLCLYDIPEAQRKWDIFEPVHRLWLGYIHEVLGIRADKKAYVDVKNGGAILAAADLHGALLEVVRNRCVGRVGIKGIVAKETRGTLEIITRENKLKSEQDGQVFPSMVTHNSANSPHVAVPKEHSVFKLEIPVPDSQSTQTEKPQPPQVLVFELYGSQLIYRPAERATRKLKMHLPSDL